MTESQLVDESVDEADETDDGVSRRWLVRLLVGLGIGIPVLVEASTFLGLLRSHLPGDGGDDGDTAATSTPTENDAVGVGDELLAATAPRETVREAQIDVQDGDWQFELTVEVENTGETPYALRLGTVTTTNGERVEGSASTGRIPPGETETVTGTWPLPSNDWPETVTVIALAYDGDDVGTTERQVKLGQVPVRG